MTAHNYLSIVPLNCIYQDGEQFYGLIKPTNYSSWSMHEALTLILEGIHQFGVKISLLTNPPNHNQSGSRIPGQLKHVIIKGSLSCADHQIKGTCVNINDLSLVTFSVSTLDSTELIEGQLYIATAT